MTIKFSNVIEYKLRFLKLTRAGKIRLAVFDDKVLYKAMDKMGEIYTEIPKDIFSIFFALCLLMVNKLDLAPNWDKMNEYQHFDNSGDVTLEGEEFDNDCVTSNLKNFQSMNINVNTQPRGSFGGQGKNTYANKHHAISKSGGPTFDRGVTYWKYGKEYKYPDQAINSKETNPSQSDPEPRRVISEEERINLDPVVELKKAIKSGNINKQGLAFLRDTFIISKPELIPIIDAHLKGEATPDDTQTTAF